MSWIEDDITKTDFMPNYVVKKLTQVIRLVICAPDISGYFALQISPGFGNRYRIPRYFKIPIPIPKLVFQIPKNTE